MHNEFFSDVARDLELINTLHSCCDSCTHQIDRLVAIAMVDGKPYIYSDDLTNEDVAAVLHKALNELPVHA